MDSDAQVMNGLSDKQGGEIVTQLLGGNSNSCLQFEVMVWHM